MAKKKTAKGFSPTRAVRANARERLGQPKPARVLAERPARDTLAPRHKATLADLLSQPESESEPEAGPRTEEQV